jgi:hypothetical protein
MRVPWRMSRTNSDDVGALVGAAATLWRTSTRTSALDVDGAAADPGDSDENIVAGAFGVSSAGRATACFALAVGDDADRVVLRERAAARLDVVRCVADAETVDGAEGVAVAVPATMAPRCWKADAPPPTPR